jgi:glycerol-1-phosphate dehydrogenase [NAD(P)+]
MISFQDIKLPAILSVGKNRIEEIKKLLLDHNFIFDKTVIISTKGILGILKSKLNIKYDQVLFVTDSDFDNLNRILQEIKYKNNCLIIGIGGGKVIDITKCVATKLNLNYLSMPTALSNDGIYSPVAVISHNNKKERLGANIPSGIIIDIGVVRNAPPETVRAGIGDLLSNSSALEDWKLAKKLNKEKINDFAYSLSYLSYETIRNYPVKDIMDYEFLKKLAYSLVLSGMAMEIAGSSRPCSGAEHIFSHTIDYLYPKKATLHGIQVALGNLVAELLRGKNIDNLIKFYKKVGLPVSYKEIGLSNKEFINVIKTASKTKRRFTVFNKKRITEKLLASLTEQL